MATIQITIPDAQLQRVLDAFTDSFGYAPMILDNQIPPVAINNPETRAQFAKRMVAQWIKGIVVEREVWLAGEAARQTATTDAQGISIT